MWLKLKERKDVLQSIYIEWPLASAIEGERKAAFRLRKRRLENKKRGKRRMKGKGSFMVFFKN